MTLTHTYKSVGILTLLSCTNSALMAAPDFAVSIHGRASAGITDGIHSRTGIHAHDPNNDYNLQGLDIGLSMRANEFLEGFVNYNAFTDADEKFDGEWEEAFLKLKDIPLPGVPGTFEARAGMFLNRIGTENNVHLHSWDYVNANLSTGMFLGEEGLRTEGVEVSWNKETSTGIFSISGSFGKALEHEHDHGDEEHEEDHGDEEHEDDDHDDHDDHEGENESRELAYFTDDLVTLRGQLLHNQTDFFQHRAGVNFANGRNGYGRDTNLFGVDYTFTWREKGLEAGGKEISAGMDYFNRNVEWQEEMDLGDTGQQSFALKTSYAWNENWRLGARYEWIEAATGDVFSMEEYQRASMALTHTKIINDDWSTQTRLQYNHDRAASDSSNNLYLQLGFSYGGNEVR